MEKRGHAGSVAVVLAAVGLGIDVGTFVDFCRVFSSCVFSSGSGGFVLSGSPSPA